MEQKAKPMVKLVGEDGNIFAIVGKCSKALKRAGMPDLAKQMTSEVFACGSYNEALQIVMKYVEVT
jgi:hypothetical protein